jgi:hypothetical protein
MQFGLGTLLFGTFCIAGLLGGYVRGYSAGETQRYSNGFYARVYYVDDLIQDAPTDSIKAQETTSLRLVAHLIETTVSPRTWSCRGGKGTVAPFESNGAIVVHAHKDVQDQVADLLEQLRRIKLRRCEQGLECSVCERARLNQRAVEMHLP